MSCRGDDRGGRRGQGRLVADGIIAVAARMGSAPAGRRDGLRQAFRRRGPLDRTPAGSGGTDRRFCCSRGRTQLVKGSIVTSIFRRATGAVIVALSLAFSAAGAVQAQEQYEQEKLESFVVAALAVNELVEQWTPRIQGAQDETEAAQLRDQANSELVNAINQANGITVEEYRQISQAAQADPALMARISEIFDDMQPEQSQQQQ
jgi:hypothetical protein